MINLNIPSGKERDRHGSCHRVPGRPFPQGSQVCRKVTKRAITSAPGRAARSRGCAEPRLLRGHFVAHRLTVLENGTPCHPLPAASVTRLWGRESLCLLDFNDSVNEGHS